MNIWVRYSNDQIHKKEIATQLSACAALVAIRAMQSETSKIPASLDWLGFKELDGWGKPFQIKTDYKFQFQIISSGPDGIMDTADDFSFDQNYNCEDIRGK